MVFANDVDIPNLDEGGGSSPPGRLDKQIMKAIMFCWQLTPVEKRSLDYIEAEIRRMLGRIFAELHEDEHWEKPQG